MLGEKEEVRVSLKQGLSLHTQSFSQPMGMGTLVARVPIKEWFPQPAKGQHFAPGQLHGVCKKDQVSAG